MATHWTADASGEVPLKVGANGYAALEPTTVYEVFKATVEKHGKRNAISVKRNDEWQTWNYNEYFEDCKMAAKSFIKLGLERFHAVNILGFNSPEWFISDIGAIFAGGFAAGIYTTNGPEACAYVAKHSGANILVVENDMQLQKILQIRDDLPSLRAIVQYTGSVSEELRKQDVYDWNDFMRLGRDVPDHELMWRINDQKPAQCSTLIYTSGTTGDPKAVMVSHDNITWVTRVAADTMKVCEKDVIISYLPLSHIAAQMVDIHAPLLTGASVWFARPDALKGTLGDTLKEVRPTVFLGVPRVWEKIQEKMLMLGRAASPGKKKIGAWAKSKGLAAGYAKQRGEKNPSPIGTAIAGKLVFKKVKKALGLDRCRYHATAAAPIAKETLDYFLSLGIPIYEVYGMSECTGPQTMSLDKFHITGSTGVAVKGTELKIDNPDEEGNGEICFRGRHIFMGYLNNAAKTQETIDEEGWLHSGDIGKLDEHGFLFITGRIKELIITAGGENVAPVPIEDRLKEAMPIISNAMVIGDKKKFLSVLLTLKCEVEEDMPTDKLHPSATFVLKEVGSNAETVSAAIADPKVLEYVEQGLKKANEGAVSRAQKVQKFKLLSEDFSIPGGELGPTLKLKRPIVVKKYASEIDSIYA